MNQQSKGVDLTKITGKGEFACPKCGVTISPDDETEEVYSILEVKVKKQILKELLIQCNKCTNQIRITGFSILKKQVYPKNP